MSPSHIAWSSLLFVWTACANAARAPDVAVVPAVIGHVSFAPGLVARGPLVVTWMSDDEATVFRTGRFGAQLARDLITRSAVVGDVGAGFTVHPGRGRVVLLAAVDTSHHGWEALFGEGEGTLVGMSAPFEAAGVRTIAPTFELATQPTRPRRERCAGDRITLEHVEAPEVAGTVGNSTSRRLCVRVPTGYDAHPTRHYSVIYLLPGLHSDDQAAIGYGLDLEDVIIVGVDTSTKTGSTYLVDSATSGHWDTFFANDVIAFVDAHFRTIPRREARALAGNSTGGFNAMSYGLRHPDLFGVIGASSPDPLELRSWLGDGPQPRPWIREFQRVERQLGGIGQFISYAADWSPTPGGYDWPFDAQGNYIERVVQRWVANSPSTLLADPARAAAARQLSGNIYVTVGDDDEFDLYAPTVAFSRHLTAVGIAHQLEVTHGGHGNLTERMAAIGRFCASRLASPRDHAE